ncbi:hypothetical protein A6R68_19398, partial [Neotoma lepida]
VPKVCINPMEFINPDYVAAKIPKAADTSNLSQVPKEPPEGHEHDEMCCLRWMCWRAHCSAHLVVFPPSSM